MFAMSRQLKGALMAAGGLWLLIKPGKHDRWLH